MNFTAHNVLLDNGEYTMGKDKILLADSAMWTSIAKTVDLFFPDKNERKNLRTVDLGCLEGGYAVEFARMGFDSLGIEAREDNIAACNYVKSNLHLSNLNFAQDDVRNMCKYGKFDITLCYGLLYHLDNPVEFLKTMSSCTTKMLLLNTHFAPEHDVRYNLGFLNQYLIAPIQKRMTFLQSQKNYRLSRATTHENFRGRWYKEWNESASKNKVQKMLWASYNNSRSFWLFKKDLTKAMHDAGFDHVFEQFDFTGDLAPDNYTQYYNRTMFVAIKK